MSRTVIRGIAILALGLFPFACVASAQDAPPVRVRGTIDHLEGETLVVKARDSSELKVNLAQNCVVVATVKASLADIKPGTFVGVSGMPQPDGS
jgi:hypothetical protein